MYIVKYKYTDNLIYLYIKIGTQITVVMVLKILILNTTRTEGLETKNLMMVKVRIKSTFPLMNVVAFKLVSLQFSQELWLWRTCPTRLFLRFRLTPTCDQSQKRYKTQGKSVLLSCLYHLAAILYVRVLCLYYLSASPAVSIVLSAVPYLQFNSAVLTLCSTMRCETVCRMVTLVQQCRFVMSAIPDNAVLSCWYYRTASPTVSCCHICTSSL